MGIFDALFGNPAKNLPKPRKDPTKGTIKGYDKAMGQFSTARSVTDPFYSGAVETGSAAGGRLYDLLGLNGASAGQSAMEGIPETPGYQAGLDSGLKAIGQGAASRGMLRSGDTLKGESQFGQDYWWQTKYRPYLDDLARMQGQGFVGARGLEGNASTMGQLQIGKGSAKDQGKQMYDAANMQREEAIAAGEQARAGNLLGLIGTGVSLATGMPVGLGGMGGGGGASAPKSYYQPYMQPRSFSPGISDLMARGYGGLY